MVKTFKTLLNVKIYELTGDEIGEIKKQQEKSNRFYDSILPEYCLHTENGTLRTTADYLQWIVSGEEKYLLFEAHTLDDILHEEISNSGLETVLDGIDLRPYFKSLYKLNKRDLIYNQLQSGQSLIVNIVYSGGNFFDDDFDCEIYVDGVLTNNLEIIKYE